VTLRLGVSQLVCWGISYYVVGVFARRMAADLRLADLEVQAGFSASLVIMGLASPLVGRLVDARGGRPVMVAGSLLTAAGCALLSSARGLAHYYAAWLVLGLAMRMTLYEAAFAALARIGGPGARRAISQVTLLGGLASTVFWPIGNALADAFGWRSALLAYAGFAVLTVPLHLGIPAGRFEHLTGAASPHAPPLASTRGERVLAGALYALVATLTTFLNTGMSAHMIGILAGLGAGGSAAVWVSTLRGVGQSSARLAEVLSGSRLGPLALGVVASAILPVSFLAGLAGGSSRAAAVAFALAFGAGNGLVTIVRGTLPLALFDPRSYGAVVGGLVAPSFLVAAAAPLALSALIARSGEAAALELSAGVAAAVLAASIALAARFGRKRRLPRPTANGA
jgi:MFS family permease